jgi:CheY-like chemotaxis protein
VLVDNALGAEEAARLAAAVPGRRIVLITPPDRHALPELKTAGFDGYLVKPVRAASLKAQLAGAPEFEAAPAVDESAAAPVIGPVRPLNVLIAEDNEINALLTRSLLTALGHRTAVAESGAYALARWQAAREAGQPFDLILMDMHMPGVDGLEAARRIRAAETDGLRTPIVALTANAFTEDRVACRDAGMDGFLVKPLDRDRLAAALNDAAGKAAMAA